MPATIGAATALISSVVSTVGATAAAAGSTSLIGGFLGTTILGGLTTVGQAIGLGLSLIGQVAGLLLTDDGPRQPTLPPATSQAEVYEPARARFLGVGPHRSAGSVIFHDNSGPDEGGDLFKVIVYDCGPIFEVTSVAINGEVVTLDGDGWVQTPARWQDKVQIRWTLGEDNPTAFQEMIDAFPGRWTSAHQGKGLATVMVRQQRVGPGVVQETYPNGARGEHVTVTARRAADILDPRTGLTGYSDNAALVALWWLMHPSGFAVPIEDINLDDWKAAADACDVEVATATGVTTRRYMAAGQFALDADKGDQLKHMLHNFDAALQYDDQGRIGVRMSHPDDGITIARHMVGNIAYDTTPTLLDGIEAAVGVFTDPDTGYNQKTTVAFPRPPVPGAATASATPAGSTSIEITPGTIDADLAEQAGIQTKWFAGRMFWLDGILFTATGAVEDGGTVTVTVDQPVPGMIPAGAAIETPAAVEEIQLPFSPNASQSQRLIKRMFLRLRAPELSIAGTAAWLTRRVPESLYLDFAEAGDLRWVRLTGWRMTEAGAVEAVLRHIPPAYDVWQPGVEEAINPLPAALADGRVLAAPVIDDHGSENGDGTVWVVWDAPAEEVASMQVMRSDPDAATWRDLEVIENPADRLAFLSLGSEVGLVDLRFRFLTAGGAATTWTLLEDVDPFTATTAPPDLDAGEAGEAEDPADNPPTNEGGEAGEAPDFGGPDAPDVPDSF